jgi:hypothetical protein
MSRLAYPLIAFLATLSGGPDLVSAQVQSPSQAEVSSVWITRIDPPISVTLTPGSTVRFLVDAEYTLAVADGRLALFIQGAELENARIASDVTPITRGSSKVSFAVDAKIPHTRHVDVITAIYTGPNQPTQITDSRVFEVTRAAQK